MLAAVPAVRVPAVRNEHVITAPTVRRSVETVFRESGLERLLEPGELLVRPGEPKSHIYRVVDGLTSSFWMDPAAGRKAVGFSFKGEIIGLGGLDRHVVGIAAVGSTLVQCLPRADLYELLAGDETLAARHGTVTNTEMALLRDTLVAEGRAHTVGRVAALLVVLAANNGYEGRARDVISDDLTCGAVAGQLGIDLDALEAALVALRRMGLIGTIPGGGLKLLDIATLEHVAECA